MNPADGGSFHFGLFMVRDVPELLLQGRERAFFQWWFLRLSAAPGIFTPEEIDAVTASYRGQSALRSGFEHYRTLLEDCRTNRAWADAGAHGPAVFRASARTSTSACTTPRGRLPEPGGLRPQSALPGGREGCAGRCGRAAERAGGPPPAGRCRAGRSEYRTGPAPGRTRPTDHPARGDHRAGLGSGPARSLPLGTAVPGRSGPLGPSTISHTVSSAHSTGRSLPRWARRTRPSPGRAKTADPSGSGYSNWAGTPCAHSHAARSAFTKR